MKGVQAPTLGAIYLGGDRCQFRVWAPRASKVAVLLHGPSERVSLEARDRGYHEATVEGIPPGTLYEVELDRATRQPDPASRSQPHGVHGPSMVVDPTHPWEDSEWRGFPLRECILYEIHVGTFTPEGTLEAALGRLDDLRDLGITAIELMPVSQFPGRRNWGYDGVYPYAVQDSYGGPGALKAFVNACHGRGLAVVLDVVYNHVGPEGNHLADFGPYFTSAYRTPWGAALNFDGPGSDEVRRFFIENAIYWTTEFHLDGLRLDALHAILDVSPFPFVHELADAVHAAARALGREVWLFAESDRNDARLVRPPEAGGAGLDAHWNDDFHHALHALLTGERGGYYQDFGTFEHLWKAFSNGYVYSGEYSAYRGRRHGTPCGDLPPWTFVVFAQNHDQVGNRMLGERLGQLVSFERQKLAAGAVLLSPFVPLLFMGEEYGDPAPFLYFVDHSEPALIEAVRRGRREDFRAFAWKGEPPDPQDEATFLRCKLNPSLRKQGSHSVLRDLYRELIALRRSHPALRDPRREAYEVQGLPRERILCLRRWTGGAQVAVVFSLNESKVSVSVPLPAGPWRRRMDSADERWAGPGGTREAGTSSKEGLALTVAPESFTVFEREDGG